MQAWVRICRAFATECDHFTFEVHAGPQAVQLSRLVEDSVKPGLHRKARKKVRSGEEFLGYLGQVRGPYLPKNFQIQKIMIVRDMAKYGQIWLKSQGSRANSIFTVTIATKCGYHSNQLLLSLLSRPTYPCCG